jgi:hypothetical protein
MNVSESFLLLNMGVAEKMNILMFSDSFLSFWSCCWSSYFAIMIIVQLVKHLGYLPPAVSSPS